MSYCQQYSPDMGVDPKVGSMISRDPVAKFVHGSMIPLDPAAKIGHGSMISLDLSAKSGVRIYDPVDPVAKIGVWTYDPIGCHDKNIDVALGNHKNVCTLHTYVSYISIKI